MCVYVCATCTALSSAFTRPHHVHGLTILPSSVHLCTHVSHSRWRRKLAQMNEALRLPQDSNCNDILCSGAREVWQVCRVVVSVLNIIEVRMCCHVACALILVVLCDVHIDTNACAQTLRYLALLPKDNLKDGRQDWSSTKFIFNDVVSVLTPLLCICREFPGNEKEIQIVCASNASRLWRPLHSHASCSTADSGGASGESRCKRPQVSLSTFQVASEDYPTFHL